MKMGRMREVSLGISFVGGGALSLVVVAVSAGGAKVLPMLVLLVKFH